MNENTIKLPPYLESEPFRRYITPRTSSDPIKLTINWDYVKSFIKNKYKEIFSKPVQNNTGTFRNPYSDTWISSPDTTFTQYNKPNNTDNNLNIVKYSVTGK